MTRVAIPCEDQRIASHFGHATHFALIDADPDSGQIVKEEFVEAPPHQPGLLPKWLAELGANVVLAGGMGGRAAQLFGEQGIQVMVGVSADSPKQAVEAFLAKGRGRG